MANAWDGVLAAGAVNDEWAAFYAQQAMRMSTTDGSAPRFDTVAAAPAPAPAPAAPAAGNVNPGGSATFNETRPGQPAAQTGPLTAAQMAEVQNQLRTGPTSDGTIYNGQAYLPRWDVQYSGQDTQLDPTLGGYRRFTPRTGDQAGTFDGIPYEDLDASGNVIGTGTLSGIDGGSLWDYGPFLMLAAGMAPALLGTGAAAGGAGAGELATGGFLGESVASGIPAWDAAAGLSGAGLGAGNGAFLGENMASGVPAWDAAATNAGLSLTVPPVLPPGSTGLPPGAVMSTPMELLPVPPAANLSTVAPLAGAGSALSTLGQVAQVAAPIVGGIVSSNAARDAADTQAAAGREANALVRELYYDQVNRAEPFRVAGVQSVNSLADRLGVSGRTGSTGYGELTKKFGMADYQADPGYAFRMSEGQKALDRRLAAGGNLYSGKAIKDTIAYGQGMGAQEYGAAFDRWDRQNTNTYNRLAGVAGAGQTANSQLSSAAQNYGNTAAGITTSIGNARAAGQVGSANALMNGITQGVSSYMNNNILDRVLSGRGY